MSSNSTLKKLAGSELAGTTPISYQRHQRYEGPVSPDYIYGELGVIKLNGTVLEVISAGHRAKSSFSSGVGVMFLMGVGISIVMLFQAASPVSAGMWYFTILSPFTLAAIAGFLYAVTRNIRGSCIRLSRRTRKLYYTFPSGNLVVLDWDELKPLEGYLPITNAGGYTSFHPLCLVGIDWTKLPPEEFFVSCGNLGWRDQGETARKLWSYMQHFMSHGPQGLPAPPPLISKMSRNQAFLHSYRQWGRKFREDLSSPKGKRWGILWIPAKVLWLITMVFPESIGDYLDYTIPEVRFSKEVDDLCEVESSSRDA